ncbi:hypothetical protein ACLB2K_026985 [Fragaria x ananassa]
MRKDRRPPVTLVIAGQREDNQPPIRYAISFCKPHPGLCRNTHPPPSHIKWHPPPPNSLKANFDGSLLPPSCVATGFVVCNSDGIPVLATSQNLGRLGILLAEDVALCVGLQLLATYTTQPIIIEGDSKLLLDALNALNDRSQIPWRLKVLVRDIQALSSHFQSISFKHVWREANFLADSLAKLGHSCNSPQLWISYLPLFLANAFQLDLFGGGCAQGFSL